MRKREEKKIERGNGSSRMDDASDRTLTHILYSEGRRTLGDCFLIEPWWSHRRSAASAPVAEKHVEMQMMMGVSRAKTAYIC